LKNWHKALELGALMPYNTHRNIMSNQHNACRPQPPSLKEQALGQLDGISTCFRATYMGDLVCDKIRAALEALPND
jgi:hypothetical protein